MRKLFLTLVFSLSFVFSTYALKVGEKAIPFSLSDTKGKITDVQKILTSKPLILWFTNL